MAAHRQQATLGGRSVGIGPQVTSHQWALDGPDLEIATQPILVAIAILECESPTDNLGPSNAKLHLRGGCLPFGKSAKSAGGRSLVRGAFVRGRNA